MGNFDPKNYIGEVTSSTPGDYFEVTLTLDTSEYADGDVLAAPQEIENFFRTPGGMAQITAIRIVDDAGIKGDLDLLFLRTEASIGAENAAYEITDAEQLEIQGEVDVDAADYKDWTSQATAWLTQKRLGEEDWQLDILKAEPGSTSLWIAAIARAVKTYGAAGLKLQIWALQA